MARKKNRNFYDLNSLLSIGTIILCTILLLLYLFAEENFLINENTIIIFFFFAAQNLFILSYEKKKNDPFIIILIANALIFYLGRVVTLAYDPLSTHLLQVGFSYIELNEVLIYLFFSNAAIFLGIISVGKNHTDTIEIPGETAPPNVHKVLMLLVVMAIVSLNPGIIISLTGKIGTILNEFLLNYAYFIIFAITYLVLYYKRISDFFKIGIVATIILYLIITGLQGSRSGILYVLAVLTFTFLVIKGKVVFSKKVLLILTALIPLAIIYFQLSTDIRMSLGEQRSRISKSQLDVIEQSDIFKENDLKVFLRPTLDRMGYLDSTMVLVNRANWYAGVINPEYYLKSIIDNALTPGFDIFNIQKASDAVKFLGTYFFGRKDMVSGYHSDMFTVYGEYYVLFHGYFSLLFIFGSAYIFNLWFYVINSKDLLFYFIHKLLVLVIFYSWLNSYGLDWLSFEMIKMMIALFFFLWVINSSKTKKRVRLQSVRNGLRAAV